MMKHLHVSLRHSIHSLGNDYDFRIPAAFRYLAYFGIAVLALGLLISEYRVLLVLMAIVLIVPAALVWAVVQLARQRRFRVRDRMMSSIPLRGNERILDVGTGNGITLIGFAKRFSTGKGVGIDIWDPHAGGGTPDIFWRNARAEGVTDKLELQNSDARQMSFADESFDAVVSSFALHHIADGKGGLDRATHEMMRVLKVGGHVSIYDISPMINASARIMERAGLNVSVQTGRMFSLLTAQKDKQTVTPVHQEQVEDNRSHHQHNGGHHHGAHGHTHEHHEHHHANP